MLDIFFVLTILSGLYARGIIVPMEPTLMEEEEGEIRITQMSELSPLTRTAERGTGLLGVSVSSCTSCVKHCSS